MSKPSPLEADAILDALDDLAIADLVRVIERARALHGEKRAAAHAALVEEFQARARALGVDDVPLPFAANGAEDRPSPRAVGQRRPAAVKYRGPLGEEWSGRGRTPRWLQALEAQGRSRDDFLASG